MEKELQTVETGGKSVEELLEAVGEKCRNAEERKLIKAAADDYPPFSYHPFDYPPYDGSKIKKQAKSAVTLACFISAIVLLCLLSIIVSQLPFSRELVSYFKLEELTPEQEKLTDALCIKVLIAFGVGLLIVAALTAAVGFLVGHLKGKIQVRNSVAAYESEKSRAYAEYENKRSNAYVQYNKEKGEELKEILRKRAYSICEFCGGGLKRKYVAPELKTVDNSYLKKVYDVNVTGYDTATVTERYERVGDSYKTYDYTNFINKVWCPHCGYSLRHSKFNVEGSNVHIVTEHDCKIEHKDIKKTRICSILEWDTEE